MNFPVALQLYSVRDDLKADFKGTLEKVKEFGYDGVEFAGLHGYSPKEVKEMCEEVGIVPISAHVPYMEMIENPDVFKEYKEIGCEFVVIPSTPSGYRPGEDGFVDYMDSVKELVVRAAKDGIKFGYHNHDFEFVKIDGEYGIDIFYKEIPDIMPQFDCCWVKVAGEEPTDYIRKYGDRQEILHLKDFVGTKSKNMYNLIGVDENENKETDGEFEFRPVGYGKQNFPEILEAAEEVGIKWVVVEQDKPSMGKTPMECAEMSVKYLKSL